MDIISLVKCTGVNYDYFNQNYEKLSTIVSLCNVLHIEKIENLNICSNNIKFAANCPNAFIIKAKKIYGNCDMEASNIDNNISIRVST